MTQRVAFTAGKALPEPAAIPEFPIPSAPQGWSVPPGGHPRPCTWAFQPPDKTALLLVMDGLSDGQRVRSVDLTRGNFWPEPEEVFFALTTAVPRSGDFRKGFETYPSHGNDGGWSIRLWAFADQPARPPASAAADSGTKPASLMDALVEMHTPPPPPPQVSQDRRIVWGPLPLGWSRHRSPSGMVHCRFGQIYAIVTEDRTPTHVERQISVTRANGDKPSNADLERAIRALCGPQAVLRSKAWGPRFGNCAPLLGAFVTIPPDEAYEATIPTTFDKGWPRWRRQLPDEMRAMMASAPHLGRS